MQWMDVAMFALIFFVTYLLGAGFVKLIHLMTKDHTKNYRVGVIIFALLVAATITYNNLGRWVDDYPDLGRLFQINTSQEGQ